jgi:hypothetical protein
MKQDWWWELAGEREHPWTLGFSSPASRVLWKLEHSANRPDFQPLKELLLRVCREGIPQSAKRIRAAVPLFKLEVGEFRVQLRTFDDVPHLVCVERVRYGAAGASKA